LIVVILGAALILALAVIFTDVRLQSSFSEGRVGGEAGRAAVDAASRLQRLLVDLESGERGFLLTGDARQLAPYDAALAEIPTRLGQLRRLRADQPERVRQLDELAATIGRWQTEAAQPEMAARRAAGQLTPALEARLRDGAGRQLIDAGLAQLEQLLGAEAKDREQRIAKLDASRVRLKRFIGISLTLAGLVVLALGLLSSITLRRGVRRLVDSAQRIARGEFDTLIVDERDSIAPLATALRSLSTSLSERDRHAETLRAVSRVGGVELDSLLAEITQALTPVVDIAYLMLVEIEDADVRRVAAWPNEALPPAQGRKLEGTAIAAAIARGGPLMVDDVSDDRYYENGMARSFGISRYLILPLRIRGQITHAIFLVVRGMHTLGAEAQRFFDIFGRQVASIIANTRLTRELATRNVELELASRAKSEFLALMSHELRTPLNSIIGFSEVLIDSKFGALNDRQDRYVRNINDSGQYLLRLISDLLDMSKIEAGRLEVNRDPCLIGPIITEALALLQPLADEKQLEIVPPAEPLQPALWADALRVKQVLFNLLSNAIKFTPPGGRIAVLAEPTATGALRVTVADSGDGIAAGDLPKLFVPFSQLPNARRESLAGTGLGLALVRRLMELMEGRVSVESTLGQGSRFWFELPLAPPVVEGVVTQEISAGHSAPADAAGDAPLALIVDDDPAASELMQLTLSKARFRWHTVASGEAGLQAARTLLPSVILLDVFLPDRDGWDVMRALRADPRTEHIPVVLVSISGDRQHSFSLGAADHLVKPFTSEALMAALARRSFTTKVKQQSVRILVVDDDPQHCELMRATLEPRGFAVSIAATGEEGLAQLEVESFDLVLLDLVLPGISGVEVAMRLRDDDRTRRLPILLLTANQLSASDRTRLQGSIEAVLAKSELGATDLIGEVRRALGSAS
jgi:signal transduction histidine kinase/DNA-binding response OmpR family regulator/CHASE3 domain sensor protein